MTIPTEIITAAAGAALGALGTLVLNLREQAVRSRRRRRAHEEIRRVLRGFLEELKERGKADCWSQHGLFYRHLLSGELRRLARASRSAIDGHVFVGLIRVAAALRSFTLTLPEGPIRGSIALTSSSPTPPLC